MVVQHAPAISRAATNRSGRARCTCRASRAATWAALLAGLEVHRPVSLRDRRPRWPIGVTDVRLRARVELAGWDDPLPAVRVVPQQFQVRLAGALGVVDADRVLFPG